MQACTKHGRAWFWARWTFGFEQAKGDAIVLMMADESDDCRDVVLYWQVLNEG